MTEKRRRKLLWVGDACVASGFARVTHHTLDILQYDWDVKVLGVNTPGDPHKYPYEIYPAMPGGDLLGWNRLGPMVEGWQPDVVVLLTDVWHVPNYLNALKTHLEAAKCDHLPKMVGWIAVDGLNVQGEKLNGLDLAMFWTQFAEREAREGGMTIPSAVVGLGVDLETYKPYDRAQVRALFQKPDGSNPVTEASFVVGNVNRNQQRKRFDLSVEAFCEWVASRRLEDVYMYLHSCPTGDEEYNVIQLFRYHQRRLNYPLTDKLLYVRPPIGQGVSEKMLAATYSNMDVYLSTSQGEGWGLPAMEAMACGVVCVLGKWAAYAEWAKDAAWLVNCPTTSANFGFTNVIGGVPDKHEILVALDNLYSTPSLRESYRNRGLACVRKVEHRWSSVGKAFGQVLDEVVPPREEAWATAGVSA